MTPAPAAVSSPAPTRRSLLARIAAAVVSLGAVAGAVTAVIGLWPDPDPTDKVTIRSVDVNAPVHMSDVKQSASVAELATGSAAPRDAGQLSTEPPGSASGAARLSVLPVLATDAVPDAGTRPEDVGSDRLLDVSTPDETDPAPASPSVPPSLEQPPSTTSTDAPADPTPSSSQDSPTQETPPTESPAPDASTESETDSQPGSRRGPPAAGRAGESALSRLSVSNDQWDERSEGPRRTARLFRDPKLDDVSLPPSVVQGSLPAEQAGDADVAVANPLMDETTLDPDGQPVPPEVAVERLSKKVRAVRNAVVDGKLEVEVARVNVNLDIEGLRGRPVVLYVRLLTVGGESALPEGWLQSHPVFRITTRSDQQTASAVSWVPLPKAEGRYKVEVRVRDAEAKTWLAQAVEALDA